MSILILLLFFLTPQAEPKRITLVLQPPSQGGTNQASAVTVGGTPSAGAGQQGQQPRLVLGSLPGKLVLQGGQLAALTQARAGQTGAQPKVLTIQLQVQQQPSQQGAKVSLKGCFKPTYSNEIHGCLLAMAICCQCQHGFYVSCFIDENCNCQLACQISFSVCHQKF